MFSFLVLRNEAKLVDDDEEEEEEARDRGKSCTLSKAISDLTIATPTLPLSRPTNRTNFNQLSFESR